VWTGAGFSKPYDSPDDPEYPHDSNCGSTQVPSPFPAPRGDAAVKFSARSRTQHTKDHSPNPPQNPQEHDETRSALVRIELHKTAADAAWEKYIDYSENFDQELEAHAKRGVQDPEACDKYRREIWIPEVRRLSQLNDEAAKKPRGAKRSALEIAPNLDLRLTQSTEHVLVNKQAPPEQLVEEYIGRKKNQRVKSWCPGP
jgi:hypothetical protein